MHVCVLTTILTCGGSEAVSERLRGCGQGSATADPLAAAPPRPAARAGAAAGRCYEESVSPPSSRGETTRGRALARGRGAGHA